jgi:hypothetical protein
MSRESDVTVPFWHAVISGGFAACGAVVVVATLLFAREPGIGIVSVVVGAVVWRSATIADADNSDVIARTVIPLCAGVFAGVVCRVALDALLPPNERPLYLLTLPPLAWFGAAMYVWAGGLSLSRDTILKVERITGKDINSDGVVGEPVEVPVDNYIPVYHGDRNVGVVDVPEPPSLSEGERLVVLRPSTRTIKKCKLWGYLLSAFESGDWTRDGRQHIGQKEWTDVRGFVSRWDGVWGTDDPPTLDRYLRSLGWTGPNGTERNERNGENDDG